VSAPLKAPAVAPGLRAEIAQPATVSTPLEAPAVSPGMKAELAGGNAAEATDATSDVLDAGGFFRGR
jgi:hypothetical protein